MRRIFALSLFGCVCAQPGNGGSGGGGPPSGSGRCFDDESDTTQSNVCAMDGSDYSYTETVGSLVRQITTTHCPNRAYVVLNPNYPYKESRTYRIPRYPEYSPGVTASLVAQGGSIGVLFDGAMLYSAYGGSNYGALDSSYANDYQNSAPRAEGDTFDMCNEHAASQTDASWHAHVPPSCLLHQLGQTESNMSPQIGWALDGFPVYGPLGPEGIQVKSCDEPTANQAFCTDSCGGYYGDLGDGFLYRYFVMGYYNAPGSCGLDLWDAECRYDWASEFYPFTPICFHGCCPSGVSCSYRDLPSCSRNAQDGTVAGFDDSKVFPQLDLYTAVDACNCNRDFPASCTNYRDGESCASNRDCAADFSCVAGVCTSAQSTPTPVPTSLSSSASDMPTPISIPNSSIPTPSPTREPSNSTSAPSILLPLPTPCPTRLLSTPTPALASPTPHNSTSRPTSFLPISNSSMSLPMPSHVLPMSLPSASIPKNTYAHQQTPTSSVLAALQGSVTLRGLTLAEATSNSETIMEAIAVSANVAKTAVSTVLQDYSRRRRLLQQSSVLVLYTIEASTSISDAIIAALAAVTPAEFDATLKAAAESDIFDTVETLDFTAPTRTPTNKKKSGGSKGRGSMTTTLVIIFIVVAVVFTGCLIYFVNRYCRFCASNREVKMLHSRRHKDLPFAQTRDD